MGYQKNYLNLFKHGRLLRKMNYKAFEICIYHEENFAIVDLLDEPVNLYIVSPKYGLGFTSAGIYQFKTLEEAEKFVYDVIKNNDFYDILEVLETYNISLNKRIENKMEEEIEFFDNELASMRMSFSKFMELRSMYNEFPPYIKKYLRQKTAEVFDKNGISHYICDEQHNEKINWRYEFKDIKKQEA